MDTAHRRSSLPGRAPARGRRDRTSFRKLCLLRASVAPISCPGGVHLQYGRRVKRSLAIAALLGGCAYFDSDAGNGPGDSPMPDARDPVVIPEGVWQPVPGASIANASLAAENGTVWWIFTRTDVAETGIWLGATSSIGTSVVSPALVAPTTEASYAPDVAVTPSAIVAKFDGETTMLRRYDRTGSALGDSYPLVVEKDGTAIRSFGETELVLTPDGGVRFVASLNYTEAAEVAIVDVDASGAQTSTVFLGTPDTYQSIPSSVFSLGAAAGSDGSTLVAWDRAYVACTPLLPLSTLSASVTGTTVGTIQPVGDVPEVGEMAPSIAASDATAYIIWQIEDYSRSRIALAKFPDVSTALAEIVDPDVPSYEAVLALAEPGRGAIAYSGGGYAGSQRVIAFTEAAGSVELSERRVIPRVDPDASSSRLIGLVHVGGDRYVVGWLEYRDKIQRLYATEIDFADAMMRPAPAFDAHAAPAARPRTLPCP